MSDASELQLRLNEFISKIPRDKILNEIDSQIDSKSVDIAYIFDTFVNESYSALSLIENYLSSAALKLLEVGAGICVFSLFLKSEGFNVTALEPAANGYDFFDIMKKVILEHYDFLNLIVLPIKAEELGKAHEPRHQYDLIFSNNVIEHIPNFQLALDAMFCCLSNDGLVIHTCPNYSFPYEPHLSIPVLKRMIKISQFIFKNRISQYQEMWDSLNFITAKEVRTYAKTNNLSCQFEKGLLYKSLRRMESDSLFKERHSHSIINIIYKSLKVAGLLKAIKYLPASMQSPMIFRLKKN